MTRKELSALGKCQFVAWLYYRDLDNKIKDMADLKSLSPEYIQECKDQIDLAWKVIQEFDRLIP